MSVIKEQRTLVAGYLDEVCQNIDELEAENGRETVPCAETLVCFVSGYAAKAFSEHSL